MVKHIGWVIFLGCCLLGCGADEGEPEPATKDVGASDVAVPDASNPDVGKTSTFSYYQDLKPVIDQMCIRCHQPGAIKEDVPLTTYEEVAAWAEPIKALVESGEMPPWAADSSCTDYKYDESLTDSERAMVAEWVDEGAHAGSPELPSNPAREISFATLSREDLEIEMPVEYVAQTSPDDYRCFLIPWPSDKTKFITGFGAKPGNTQVVHHIIAYLVEPQAKEAFEAWDAADELPGYACYGGPSGPGGSLGLGTGVRFIGGWAPGGVGSDFPEGTGMRVEPGSLVALQIHYNTVFVEPEPDRSSVAFKLEDQVEHEALVQPWTNYMWVVGNDMKIPAGEKDVMHRYSADPFNLPIKLFGSNNMLRVYSSALHMHIRGSKGTTFIERADGTTECLLNVPRYDFDWQRTYAFAKPVEIRAGDKLGLECHWDNTLENQPVVDGKPVEPVDLYWGEGTLDEMCIAFFYVVPMKE